MNNIVTIVLPHAQVERRFADKTEAKTFMAQAKNTYGPTADIFLSEREIPVKDKKKKKKAE